MCGCVLNWREPIAYCEGGRCVPLATHSANVLALMLGVERLRAPIESAALAFDQTLPAHLGEGWHPIIVAGALIAGAFHDIGKACVEHITSCEREGSASFFGHEVLGSALLLAAADIACADGGWNPAAALVLASYATLMHHHAMAGRGPDLLTPRGASLLRGRKCSLTTHYLFLKVRGVIMDYAGLYYPEETDMVGEALYYTYEAASTADRRGISLERAAEAVRVADPQKAMRALFGRGRRCGARVVSVVTRSLFGRSPDPVYGGLVRRAGVSIVGSLSAADTLAAGMEGRGGASAFSRRLVRELLGG